MTYVKIAALMLLIAVIVILSPLCVVWSLNVLFPVLAIPYTFDAWCAIVLLHGFVQGVVKINKAK